MKKLVMIALVAAQIGATAPTAASAAEIVSDQVPGSTKTGAFAGARVRLALGEERARPRAALTAAPTVHSVPGSGPARMRMGEGLELGIGGDRKPQLALAGQPLSQIAQGGKGPNSGKLGVSTTGWLAIGVGLVLVVVGGLYIWADSSCGEDCN
jgi:hypothetical protein